MKQTEYPNRGHLLSDYFIDGISRAYEHAGNIVVTLESPTGIETHNSILKNECVRLIIPKNEFHKFYESISIIQEQLCAKNDVPDHKPAEVAQQDDSFLGSPFHIVD